MCGTATAGPAGCVGRRGSVPCRRTTRRPRRSGTEGAGPAQARCGQDSRAHGVLKLCGIRGCSPGRCGGFHGGAGQRSNRQADAYRCERRFCEQRHDQRRAQFAPTGRGHRVEPGVDGEQGGRRGGGRCQSPIPAGGQQTCGDQADRLQRVQTHPGGGPVGLRQGLGGARGAGSGGALGGGSSSSRLRRCWAGVSGRASTPPWPAREGRRAARGRRGRGRRRGRCCS
jgi:hypothetical protein